MVVFKTKKNQCEYVTILCVQYICFQDITVKITSANAVQKATQQQVQLNLQIIVQVRINIYREMYR